MFALLAMTISIAMLVRTYMFIYTTTLVQI